MYITQARAQLWPTVALRLAGVHVVSVSAAATAYGNTGDEESGHHAYYIARQPTHIVARTGGCGMCAMAIITLLLAPTLARHARLMVWQRALRPGCAPRC